MLPALGRCLKQVDAQFELQTRGVFLSSVRLLVGLLVLLIAASPALARDDKAMYAIDSALNSSVGQASLGDDIQFFFGKGNHPPVESTIGSYTSNKKTNGFNKSNSAACERAFISALISFRDRARNEGGNAVVNLSSYYRKNHISSTSEFECGSGAVMSGITLRGDVVILK